ncbi:MAG: LLM class flavin-dependent oxidoreductase [Acidobacteria bacterium]|nr:LLM class flavin-dependent oxidoreductase [Acidobacteriota bacterium]
MQFSIYSELQSWPGKSQKQVYDEALAQCVNADRLGYDAYAIIEHFFFSKFGASPNPFAFFAKASERARSIKFRTLVHVLPYHNPTVLASQIAAFDVLVDGRYEFGVGRGHAWIAHKAGVPVEETRERYDESLSILLDALDKDRFSHDGTYYKVEDSHIVPRPARDRKFRIFLGGTSDSTYELAGERGYAMVVPPLLPYEALRSQLDIYRESCARHGNEPDKGAACSLGLRLLRIRDHGTALRHAIRRDDREGHRLGRHSAGRDRADRSGARRLRRPDRGGDHGEPGRRGALEVDQGAGAVCRARNAALQERPDERRGAGACLTPNRRFRSPRSRR